ncbi:Pr6Pr family membrane protein [Kocuria sp. M1N1S27]|uniref:Pr6Pr family membrane protein n=1 Tax=Kocuria kalidii TaxID=3376283 RepID=UPI0037B660D6
MVVFVFRVAALATAIGALVSRAGCAFVTNTCLGTNLFSYFTVHSVFLLILTLLLSTCYTVFAGSEPRWLTVFRALATTYVVVSGVVFAALLANAALFNYLFLVPVSSKVLHFVLPIYAAADFLLGPRRNRLGWSTAWLAMVFPALWALYTLFRGQMVGWYPYFFLNPSKVGGYQAVGVYALGLSGFILLVALLTVAVTRLPSTPVEQGKKRGHEEDSASPRSRSPEMSLASRGQPVRH